jgi:glycosyltransferase involved in cell wall biosynthesis/ubiquinone/menaquinone biosynthesis C-methylase UbiE
MVTHRNEQTIAVVAPIVLTDDDGRQFINDRYGRLINSFASEFARVILPAPFAERSDKAFYAEGRPIYGYELAHSNIEIRPIGISTAAMQPIKKWMVWFRRICPLAHSIYQSDIVYIVMPGFTPSLAVFISRLLRRPYIVYLGSDWETFAPFMARWGEKGLFLNLYRTLTRELERYSVRGSLFTMVTGRMLRERLEPFNDHVVETVPMIPLKRSDFFAREDTCSSIPIRLLFVGTMTPNKGARDLIEALALIRAQGIEAECNFVGGGEPSYIESLSELVQTKGMKQYVHFSGYDTNYDSILTAYRKADIFVLPTHSEGFPRVLYEAMSQSLPIVTTNIPSITAMLEHGEQALLVSPGEPTKLASAVLTIAQTPALRKRLIGRGRSFAEGRVVEDTTGDQIIRILDQVSSHPPRERELKSWSRYYYSQSRPYHERMASKWSESWLKHFEEYRNEIRRQAPARGKVLDLGCGGGQSSFLLSEDFDMVVGLDFSLALLRGYPQDKKRPNLKFINADAAMIPSSAFTFDVIASYATFEHLADLEKVLTELNRVLMPGGMLIVIGPNMLSPFRSLKLFVKGMMTKNKHPDGQLRTVFQHVWTLIRKSLSTGYEFEYRQPFVENLEFLGSDFDAICLVNPLDLKRWAMSEGYRVLSLSEGSSFGGKIISRILPGFAGGMCFVAQKGQP